MTELRKWGKEPVNSGGRAPMATDRSVFVCPACHTSYTKVWDLKNRHWKKHEAKDGKIDQYVIRKIPKSEADSEKSRDDMTHKLQRLEQAATLSATKKRKRGNDD